MVFWHYKVRCRFSKHFSSVHTVDCIIIPSVWEARALKNFILVWLVLSRYLYIIFPTERYAFIQYRLVHVHRRIIGDVKWSERHQRITNLQADRESPKSGFILPLRDVMYVINFRCKWISWIHDRDTTDNRSSHSTRSRTHIISKIKELPKEDTHSRSGNSNKGPQKYFLHVYFYLSSSSL